jgi:signal transduction histidine kinase
MGHVTGTHEALPDFRQLFESAPALLLVLTPDLRICAVSEAYLAATMTVRDEILHRSIFEVFPDNPDDPDATGVRNLRDSLMRVVRLGLPDAMAVQKYDVQRSADAGGGFEMRYWSPLNVPVCGPDGEVRYIVHRVEDVTSLVLLRERESVYAQRLDTEILQRAQEIQEVNRELRLVQAELEQRVEQRTAELAQSNRALREEMAQSQRLEEQFRQAQKMEAMGTLAAGIAHDFNNLLTVICGCSEMLLEPDGPPDDAHELAQQIHRAGVRAATLTRQLLAFSRQQVLELRRLDINTIVVDTDKMLRRLIGEDVSLTAVLSAEPLRVMADAGQVEQIIMNLVVNARDAMPQGGQLTIETARVWLDETYAHNHTDVQPGEYALLAVSDTGIGMDAATKSRIFDPFFTTKGPGKGTGLGLASVFGIVNQTGGHIWVYSEPARGTTFKIYLPIAPDDERPTRHVVESTVPTGHETILVVEDEVDVRAWTVLALRSLGYTVIEASNGREAVALSESYPHTIDVMVSDVVMPEMGGRQAAELILERRPRLKMLYLSGYTDDAVVRHGILHEEVTFLQKPFTRLALGQKVREVLSRPS